MAKQQRHPFLITTRLERCISARPVAAQPMPAMLSLAVVWPPLDIYETEVEYIVVVEVGGLAEHAVRVDVERGLVVISGTRGDMLADQAASLVRIHHQEIGHGEFCRTVKFPWLVDSAETTARLADGLLEVRLPKVKPLPDSECRPIVVT